MTFSTLAEECLRYLVQTRGYSPRTKERYSITAQQFTAFLLRRGHQDDVRAFTGDTVFAFTAALGEQGAHPNTIRANLSALRTIAKHGQRVKARGRPAVTEDPTAGFDWPERQKPDIAIPTADELRRFLAVALGAEDRLTIALLLDTGLRSSELARANVEDLQEAPEGWYLAVTVKGRGARHQKRHAPLSPAVVEVIRDRMIGRNLPGGAEPLLLREGGGRHSRGSLNHLVMAVAKRAVITRFRFGPHKLRHLANYLGKQAGLDAYTRARLRNQTSVATQAHYDHVMPGDLHAARAAERQALARYLGAPGNPVPAVDPGALARILEALGQIPADRLEAVLEGLERLAGGIRSATESTAYRLNAEAPDAATGAATGDLPS